MKHSILAGITLTLLLPSGAARADSQESFRKENAKLLIDGLPFTEGPTWDGKDHILFTSPKTNEVIRYSLKDGTRSVFFRGEEPISALFRRDGKLYATRGVLKRVVRIDAPDRFTTLADSYKGKPLNKPNDLWVSPSGQVYFTDPNYGRQPLSQDGEFAYHIDEEGEIRRIDARFERPNGIVGSEDGKLLYITDAAASKTYRFELDEEGNPGKQTLFAEVGGDGMTLDKHGNLYLAVPRQKALVVMAPDGSEIARLEDFGCTNLCFGPEGKILYITRKPGLWKLEVFGKEFSTTKQPSKPSTNEPSPKQ